MRYVLLGCARPGRVKLMLPWLLRLIQRIPWKIRHSLTDVAWR